MSESTLNPRYSGHASLAAIGNYLSQLDLLAPIKEGVQIQQKTVKYSPFDKLCDTLILLLTGAHRMVAINTCLRADPALVAACGKTGCAEQSVVQDTLDACTDQNVAQMQQAINTIFRKHSRASGHDYQNQWQLLDSDLSGRVCGPTAEDATGGYFSDGPNLHGRQEGRVYASLYEETVCVRLFTGNTNTAPAVQPLLRDAQAALVLTPEQRAKTIVRLDAGGGTVEEINACLEAGYQFHGKDFSTARARRLAKSVETWYDDPKCPGRQVGLVTIPPGEYGRQDLVRIAVRCATKKGSFQDSVLISTLSGPQVLTLSGASQTEGCDIGAQLCAYAHFYDLRGGGIECGFKQDQQGLGRRNKKRFAAQAMLLWLEALAHNVLIWAREWLAPTAHVVSGYGLVRLIRDVLTMPGRITLDAEGQILTLVLSKTHPLAVKVVTAFAGGQGGHRLRWRSRWSPPCNHCSPGRMPVSVWAKFRWLEEQAANPFTHKSFAIHLGMTAEGRSRFFQWSQNHANEGMVFVLEHRVVLGSRVPNTLDVSQLDIKNVEDEQSAGQLVDWIKRRQR